MIDAEQWLELKTIFLQALEKTADARSAFLDAACGDNLDLRAELDSMLEAHFADDPGPLDRPLVDVSQPDLGLEVGPFVLIEVIGRGGMGIVYRAERRDGSFEQTVAIKIIRRGLDTDDILSRFRHERQILASLDHPNVATLLDGGITDDGRPYFVMEYVDGVPLIEYCDRNRLPREHRLRLFQTVADTVQHAHQSLVVHRDLKPSNILVSGDGNVKLLDFGIAKLVGGENADETALVTREGQRLMTPEYAAPEQILGEPVTTRTDVYQLGIVLYQLLTGERPHRSDSDRGTTIEQAILNQDPVRPSLVRTGKSTTETARSLRGDLDTICLTALQKDPERRYPSAEQMSDDVARYLDGLPIWARAESFAYRAGKFVRRNRVAVAAAGLVATLLVAGATIYTVRVQQERDRAEQALRQSEQALSFLQDVILAGDPVEGDPETPIGAILDSAAGKVDLELAGDPEVARTLHASLGYVYMQLDRPEPSEHHLRRAHELRSSETAVEKVGRNLVNLANLLSSQGEFDEAIQRNEEALELLRSGDAPEMEIAGAIDAYGAILSAQGRDAEAIPWIEEALALYKASGHPDSIVSLNNLAVAYAQIQDLDQAMALQRRAVAGYVAQNVPPARIAIAYAVLASLYGNAGLADSAEINHRRSVRLLSQELGDRHYDTITARMSLALHLYRNDDYESAIAEAEPALADARAALTPDHPIMAYAEEITGAILCDMGRPVEGAPLIESSLETRSVFLPEGHALLHSGRSLLGGCLLRGGRVSEAEPLLRDGYQGLVDAVGPDNPMTQRARVRLESLEQTN